MKWKKPLYQTSIILLLLTTFLSIAYADWEIDDRWEIDSRWEIEGYPPTPPASPTPSVSYSNHLATSDGNCLIYGGIHLKPNTIHTYVPQFNGRYENITLNSGTLRLSKGDNAYEIASSTNDNITINLNQWFYNDKTQFRPAAENETSLSFTVNTRLRGGPQAITGVSSWSYNEDTTTISLTCGNNALVTITFLSAGAKIVVWWLDRMMMWIGIAGIFLVMLAPTMLVVYAKEDDWGKAFTYGLMFFVIGMALIIGWLWG